MSLPLSGIKCPLKLKAIEVPESMKRLGEDYFDFFVSTGLGNTGT